MNGGDGTLGGPLRNLARLRDVRSRRASSYDRTGGNDDFVWIAPGQHHDLLDAEGAGCITHIWMTSASKEPHHLRKLVLRMWWDDEQTPSVEVPLGDFFGLGHGETRNFASLPLAMSPQGGRALTCYFPMPFARRARVSVESQCSVEPVRLYYYVDYESYGRLADDLGRFHAQITFRPARRRHTMGRNTVIVLPSGLSVISLTPPSSPAPGDAGPRRRWRFPRPAA